MCVFYCDYILGWETCGCICLKRGARIAGLCKCLLEQMVPSGFLKTSTLSFNRLSQNVRALLLLTCMDTDVCINYRSTVSKMALLAGHILPIDNGG